MYMIYLVSAVALSTGISAFAQYDTITRERDQAGVSRTQIAAEQQAMIARTLRREFLIDPTRFPSLPTSGFSRLDPGLIETMMNGGYSRMITSGYFIGRQGDIIAVLEEGPTGPFSNNGDDDVGVHSPPQLLDDALTYIKTIKDQGGTSFPADTEQSQAKKQNPGEAYTLNEQEWAAIDPARLVALTRLDLDALEYELHAGKGQSSDPAGTSIPAENPDFQRINLRISEK